MSGPESADELMRRLSKDLKNPKDFSGEDLVSEKEIKTLIVSLAKSRTGSEFTEEEAHQIVKWAIEARLQITMLNLVLKGAAIITIKDGAVAFHVAPNVELPGDENAKD